MLEIIDYYDKVLKEGREKFRNIPLKKVFEDCKNVYLETLNYLINTAKANNKIAKIEKYKAEYAKVQRMGAKEFVQEYGVKHEIENIDTDINLLEDKVNFQSQRLKNRYNEERCPKDKKELRNFLLGKSSSENQYNIHTLHQLILEDSKDRWEKMTDEERLEAKAYQMQEHIKNETNRAFGEQINPSIPLQFLNELLAYDYNDIERAVRKMLDDEIKAKEEEQTLNK